MTEPSRSVQRRMARTEPADEVPLPEPDCWSERPTDYHSDDAIKTYGDARATHAARRAVEEERARVVGLLTTHLAERSGGVYVGCSCGWVVPGGWDHEDHLTFLVEP